MKTPQKVDDSASISNFSVASQSEFVDEWQKIEGAFRTLEKSHGALLVGSYMGLRISGGHFSRALLAAKDGDRDAAEHALKSAIEELRRARYEALRAQIDFSHYRLLLIEEKYRPEQIYQVCPDYYEIRGEFDSVNERLTAGFSSSSEAESFFSKIEADYIPRLMAVHTRMQKARDFALDAISERDSREDKYKLLAWGGFVVGIIGVAVSLVTVFL